MKTRFTKSIFTTKTLLVSSLAFGSLFSTLDALAQTPASKTSATSDASEKVTLVYKLQPGQVIHSEVTHIAKTNTKIDKTEQSSQSRSVSNKVWEVTAVDKSGNMTFVHKILQVDMSQQVGDAEEIRYNSTNDPEAPSIYANVAESIGKPISTITIDKRGKVVQRDEGRSTPALGMGDIALVMPENPVAIGDSWETPREIRVRDTEGGSKPIKLRELYTLEKVSAGVATISIRSEPLTPISEPEIESQVLQQLSNGTIRFDVDAGRLISKELQWDESVVGFSGSGSLMEYSARYSEIFKKVEIDQALTKAPPVTAAPAATNSAKPQTAAQAPANKAGNKSTPAARTANAPKRGSTTPTKNKR